MHAERCEKTEREAVLFNQKRAESKKRGWYEEKFEINEKIWITRWNDNKLLQ